MAAAPVAASAAIAQGAAPKDFGKFEVEMAVPDHYSPRIPERVLTAERLSDDIINGFRNPMFEGRKVMVADVIDVMLNLFLDFCVVPSSVAKPLAPLPANTTMCGVARTLRLIPLQDPRDVDLEIHPGQLIYDAKPGDIMVIDAGGNTDYTIWGQSVHAEAVRKKIGGVLIDGATRDATDIVRQGTPVFCKGTTPQHAHGIWRTTCYMSEPVQIGTMSVAPGDLILGDDDGVVVIPRLRAAEILQLVRAKVKQEEEGDRRIAKGVESHKESLNRRLEEIRKGIPRKTRYDNRGL